MPSAGESSRRSGRLASVEAAAPVCEGQHRSGVEGKSPESVGISVTEAQRMAEFFGVLGDANRLRIISLLADQEYCVGDLALVLAMSESAVSHQLRALRSQRLVRYRKQGRHVYYQLHDHHILELYRSVAEHLNENAGV